jgi:hypothetical protein
LDPKIFESKKSRIECQKHFTSGKGIGEPLIHRASITAGQLRSSTWNRFIGLESGQAFGKFGGHFISPSVGRPTVAIPIGVEHHPAQHRHRH